MLKLLTVRIETSDQYGDIKKQVIGVFDNHVDFDNAKARALNKYKNMRYILYVTDIEINKPLE